MPAFTQVNVARVRQGASRNTDLSANTVGFGSILLGNASPSELTKAILDRLIALQNGTDVDATYHTHDGRYFTESELGSATSSSGSDLIGDDNTYANFTPAAATVKGALSGIDSALGAISITPDFSDSLFRVHDNGDASKKMAFEVSAISASTVRTVTMPDANVDLGKVATALQRDGSVNPTADLPMNSHKLTGLSAGSGAGDSVRYEQAILASGANPWAANQDLGGNKITGSADPTSAQDLVTLAYMNARLLGLSPKRAVLVATTANITLSGEQTIDGQLTSASRVLVKDQSTASQNGIYVSAAGAWSRATDMDSLSPTDEVNGAWVPVQLGTVNAARVYVQYGTVATIGTDAINFEFYNPLAALVGGDMITVSGSTISVDLATVSGLESSNPGNAAGQLRVKLEGSNPSLQITGSNELAAKLNGAGALASGASGIAVQVDGSTIEINTNALRVKDAGITLAKLASNSVDENKIVSTALSSTGALTGGSGSKLAWNPDNSTLEINSNAARVKDAGITAAKLNSNVADQSTITGGAGSALAVANAPLVLRTLVAGESFAADTSFFVRWALTGETAGRVYKADKDASASNKYMAIGIAKSVAGVSAGGNIQVTILGEHTLGANDSAFSSGNVGLELFVGTAGAIILGAALADTSNEAAFCAGSVQTTTKIWVDFKQLRGIA